MLPREICHIGLRVCIPSHEWRRVLSGGHAGPEAGVILQLRGFSHLHGLMVQLCLVSLEVIDCVAGSEGVATAEVVLSLRNDSCVAGNHGCSEFGI